MVLAWFNKPQTGKCMVYEDLRGVSYTKLETSKLETVGFGGTTWDNELNLDFVNLLGIHLKSTILRRHPENKISSNLSSTIIQNPIYKSPICWL